MRGCKNMPIVDVERFEDFQGFLDAEEDKSSSVVFIYASTPINVQTGVQGFGLQVGFLVSDGVAVRHTKEVGSVQLVTKESVHYEAGMKQRDEFQKELNMLKDSWTKMLQGKGFVVMDGVVS